MFSVRKGELGMSVRRGQGERRIKESRRRSMFFKIPPQKPLAAILRDGPRAALKLFYTFMVMMLFMQLCLSTITDLLLLIIIVITIMLYETSLMTQWSLGPAWP